jgi:hypothetical protein
MGTKHGARRSYKKKLNLFEGDLNVCSLVLPALKVRGRNSIHGGFCHERIMKQLQIESI